MAALCKCFVQSIAPVPAERLLCLPVFTEGPRLLYCVLALDQLCQGCTLHSCFAATCTFNSTATKEAWRKQSVREWRGGVGYPIQIKRCYFHWLSSSTRLLSPIQKIPDAIACALSLDCSALSISVTEVAMVSLFVSASVCVSWYRSLVSMSVRPTHFDPDPVSLPFPTPLSLIVWVLVCIVSPNPQIPWYVGGISTIFPGHRCLCLARCVCKFLHGEGDKHTASRIYRSHHMAARTL